METYKKGDYIAINTSQPTVHFIEMFGHGLDIDNVEPEEYIAIIKSVVDSANYFVFIPSIGYRCIINISEVLRKVPEDELEDDDKENGRFLDSTPHFVYINNKKDAPGKTINEKCEYLARVAMSYIFPEDKVEKCEMESSEFLKSDLLSRVQYIFERNHFVDPLFQDSIRKKIEYFVEMLQHLRFKEYYSVRIGVKDELEEDATNYHMIAIDTNLEEVIIAKGVEERTVFFRSLGPEYDSIYHFYRDLMMEILTKEVHVNLKL